MKQHPLKLKTVSEIWDKNKLTYSSERISEQTAEVHVTIKNPGQPSKTVVFPFRSLVTNFARVLNNGLLNIDNSTGGSALDKIIKTVTGGVSYPAAAIHTMAVNEGALSSPTQSAFGIWVGNINDSDGLGLAVESGVGGAVAFDNYMLRRKLLADGGSPDTNLVYKATNVTLTNSDQTLTVSRRFENNSGSAIDIDEIGLVGKSGSDYFMIARDRMPDLGEILPGNSFTIAASGICEVAYTFSVTNGYTKNFLRMLSSEFVGAAALSQIRDKTNAGQVLNMSTARTQKDALAGAGVDTWGILVGDGQDYSIPFTLTASDYNVNAYINNSSLVHSAVTPLPLEQSAGVSFFGIQRDFTNGLTTDVYVNNSALILRAGTSPYYYFMIAHDYLPSQNNYLVIAPGKILRVKYIIQAPLL